MIDLSVIIPTFNRATFLLSVVESIRACGVARLEIVVVDDGSTDDTAAVASKLGVICTRQANAGPAAARNTGAAMSRGRFVAFLDSDDRWHPGIAGNVLALLNRHPYIGAIFTDAKIKNGPVTSFINWPGRLGLTDLAFREPEAGLRIVERAALFRRLLDRNFIFLGAVVMRREAFEQCGRFDPAFHGTEDWELCLRLAVKHSLGFWNEPLAQCIRHEGCLSNDTDRMLGDCCRTLLKMREDGSPEVAAHRACIDEKLRAQLFSHAYLAYDRGDYAEAGRRFRRQMQACGWGLLPFTLSAVCSLPLGLPRRLRNLKRAFGGSTANS